MERHITVKIPVDKIGDVSRPVSLSGESNALESPALCSISLKMVMSGASRALTVAAALPSCCG